MTDLTSARPVDIDWQDDETSMPDADRLDGDMRFFVLLGAGLMACVPVAFCVAVIRTVWCS